MISIGFAGTAKNTGKTTAALHVLQLAQAAGLRCGLTSIGYDGENRDNITGLPKPRYFLQPGTVLATAETCLKAGSAACRIIERTSIQTVLGPVLVAEVTGPGLVVLAGPNRQSDLLALLESFSRLGVELALIDGALNRIVPLSGTDGLVLSTGAAFDERIPKLAAHAHALASLFEYPVWPGAGSEDRLPPGQEDEFAGRLCVGSLLSEAAAADLVDKFKSKHPRVVMIPGACDPGLLEKVIAAVQTGADGVDLVFGSPLKLIASGDPRSWRRAAGQAEENGYRLAYLENIPVRLMTVNPFYPRYLGLRESYSPAYVDKAQLLAVVREQLPCLPVIDIRQPHGYDILALVGRSGEKGDRT